MKKIDKRQEASDNPPQIEEMRKWIPIWWKTQRGGEVFLGGSAIHPEQQGVFAKALKICIPSSNKKDKRPNSLAAEFILNSLEILLEYWNVNP